MEDFSYPQADKIRAEKDIVLERGDGHITLTDCADGAGQLVVRATKKEYSDCPEVLGDSGWLTMKILAVYLIRGNDNYATEVDMTVGIEEKSFDMEKNKWTSVGHATEELDPPRCYMLTEIRTARAGK